VYFKQLTCHHTIYLAHGNTEPRQTHFKAIGPVATSHQLQHQCSVVCLQTKGEVLGRLRGVSVKMLMHHSRNSEQKQWDETLVLALSGMGRLLRAHLPLLVPMQAFPQVLTTTITTAAAAAAGFRIQVFPSCLVTASAAVQLLCSCCAASSCSYTLLLCSYCSVLSVAKRADAALDVPVQN